MSASGTTLHPLPFYEPLRPEIFEVKKRRKTKTSFVFKSFIGFSYPS
jgi:hypothetical protein